MKMKAAIYHGTGDIRVEEIERPKASDGVDGLGVVCKVGACAVCDAQDIPAYRKTYALTVPGVALGHEWSGEVVEVGPKVTDVKMGDRIYAFVLRPCLKCGPCLEKDYAKCNNYREGGGGHRINGAFAEYMLLPFATKDNIVKLPDKLTFRDGALLEVMRLCMGLADKAKAGDVVAIMGMKFLGVATVARLKARGVAKKIIVSDISKKRLQKARELGADIVINELSEDITKVVMEETAGLGANVVIDTSARPYNFQKALEIVAEGNVKTIPPLDGGTVWLAQSYDEPFLYSGGLKGGAAIRQPWGTIEGFTLYKPTVEFIRSGGIKADQVVTHVFPIEKTKEAFETTLHNPDAIKVMVEP